MNTELHEKLATQLLSLCRERGFRLATAESCTGGLIAAMLTSIPGSSGVFECGIVTYSNMAKTNLLGISKEIISRDGAVSESVARLMAERALLLERVQISISVTGIAGPDGGSAEKPVGTVHVASARTNYPTLHRKLSLGDRERQTIRLLSAEAALKLAIVQAATAP